ncbi:integrator complex subunit 14 [Lucilia sericata]|uniref:integrator complex subunit 14 n=1 Tax=Lucilia sericata TaxID=13632 RepID=UPI0018A8423A|nr:integrator complex subunit 14 [Lucilia sericata]
MPTIIALDTSLSMQRTIPGRSEENALTYHQLALKGISQLLEHLAATSKLEFAALLTFSSTCELKVDFTRDYDQIKQTVKKVEAGDKLCLMSLMKSVATIFTTNWGTQSQCQVVVFTDCGLGFGSTSLKTFLQQYVGKEHEPEYSWVKVLKPVKWNFICLGVHGDSYFTRAVTVYQQLLDFTGIKGQLYMTKAPKDSESGESATNEQQKSTMPGHKSELGRTAMFEMIEKLCETNFKPYEVILKCGGYFRLECPVLLWPPPQPYQMPTSESVKSSPLTLASKLEICGYLALTDIGSPSSLSRHLIIPKVEREKPSRRSSDKSGTAAKLSTEKSAKLDVNNVNYEFEKLEQDIRDFYTKEVKGDVEGEVTNEENDKTLTAAPVVLNEMQKESMCVLLHGALKVENLAALVLLNDNWYGFIYSYADTKKKSNLMLNILPPGNNVIPWLGDLQMLGFAEDLLPGETAAFPVKADKRSYSQSCVVWINRISLQSDIQKVLRHAKKMPEKTQHFYKELNRIRRAALSIGFVELLEAMATLFDKEAINLAAVNANPECTIQLKHASIELRKPSNRDLKISIVPVPVQTVNPTAQGVAATNAGGNFVY